MTVAGTGVFDKQEILRLRAEGKSVRQVAEIVGCGKSYVHKVEKGNHQGESGLLPGPREQLKVATQQATARVEELREEKIHQALAASPQAQETQARPIIVEGAKMLSNPWQPRSAQDQAHIEALADSIDLVGLLQRPVVRPCPGKEGFYQIACGHYRVEALRLLFSRGRHGSEVPVDLRDITDADMALIALAENMKRQDITPVEEYKAYKKALEEITGLTITALATSIGIDRATLSNNLRILRLPAVVLQHFESGDLSAHGAREFLCLMNEAHCHEDVMERVIKDISVMMYGSGAPDWRVGNIRRLIRYRVAGDEQNWRPLDKNKGDRGNNEGGGTWREPAFDVEAFIKVRSDKVHVIPKQEEESRRWTCDVKEWRRLQTNATREANKAAEASGSPSPKAGTSNAGAERGRQFDQALAKDPLAQKLMAGGQSVSGETGAGKGPGELTPELKEQMGRRAEPPKVFGYGWGGFNRELRSAPPYLDKPNECGDKCTWGAQYGQFYQGAELQLFCTNQSCWDTKIRDGKKSYQEKFVRDGEQQDKEDRRVVRDLLKSLPGEPLINALARLFLSDPFGSYEVITLPRIPREEEKTFTRTPLTMSRVRDLLNLKPVKETFGQDLCFSSSAAIGRLDKATPESLQEVVANLIVYHLRTKVRDGVGSMIREGVGRDGKTEESE